MDAQLTLNESQRNRAIAFISYAREDAHLARRLDKSLEQYGVRVTGDWLLVPGPDYWTQLKELILAADVFLFVISPDSVGAPACTDEVDEASKSNKRILPILYREGYREDELHQSLRFPQWTYLRDEDDLEKGIANLRDAISTDFELMKVHTRLLNFTEIWERAGHNKAFLLRGQALRDAEEWLPQASADNNKLPNPTRTQTDFILASQQARTREIKARAGIALATAAVLVFLSILGIVKGQEASRNGQEALRLAGEREKDLKRIETEQQAKARALEGERQALATAQEKERLRKEAVDAKEAETKLKEKALTDKIAALEREKAAINRALNNKIDLELLADAGREHIPYDFERRQQLSDLLRIAKDTGYREAISKLDERMACLPSPSVRREQLPSDEMRQNIAVDRSGTRVLVAYKDRLEILDAHTYQRLLPPKPYGSKPVGHVWLYPDRYQDRVFLAFEYESEDGSREKEIEIFLMKFDESPLIHVQTQRPKDIDR